MSINKKGGIGATANLIAVVVVAIAVLAIISPATSSMFLQASANANLTGIEKVVVEHYNVVILMTLTFILFIVLWVFNN
jgi:hypothetical protein